MPLFIAHSSPIPIQSCQMLLRGQLSRISSPLRAENYKDLHRAFTFPNSPNTKSQRSQQVGLFGMQMLSSPQAFTKFACSSLERTCNIVNAMKYQHYQDPNAFVKSMDTLSDMLCTVMDAGECIRHVHTDMRWIKAAEESYATLGSCINELNTDHELYKKLKYHAQKRNQLGHEEKAVAQSLLNDFEKYGAHCPQQKTRAQIITLSNEIAEVGYLFSRHVGTNEHYSNIEKAKQLLEGMILKRSELAQTLGYETYASFCLRDKMAKDPETVYSFLKQLSRVESSLSLTVDKPSIVSNAYIKGQMFELPNVMSAAATVFEMMYGLRMEVCPSVEDGVEIVWSERVRKLNVLDERNRKVGTIYLDFGNNGPISAAQFTVRCSRRLDNDPPNAFPASHYKDLKYLGVDDENKQLPVVVLTFDFPQQKRSLDWLQVETLFHELGHAFHSMVARLQYQHISGTRCAVDIVEVPSTLMEFVIRHPFVFSIISNTDTTQQVTHQMNLCKPSDILYDKNSFKLQMYYADLDLSLHNVSISSSKSIGNVMETVGNKHGIRSSRSAYFTHLYNYGSSYYSYLWCRVIAVKVYQLLMEPALSSGDFDKIRRAGETWKREALSKGGSIDAWQFNWPKILGGHDITEFLGKPSRFE